LRTCIASIWVKEVGFLDRDASLHQEYKAKLAQWIAEYSGALLKTCYVYLHSLQQAEDAVQDTFIKAYQGMACTDAQALVSEKAWLMRIAINVCHDYHRSRWFRYIDKTVAVEALPQTLMSVLPEDRTLLADVIRLPEKFKQVLLLYYYQELTLQETADVLQISRSAVHKRLQKAQTLLKGRLTGRDFDA
jgi:RNA polymerase sigma-70 factor (ECF subfamily)